ncbi:MAG: DUF4253 domain-containing protein [Acidobacteria bacterium]|jgi:hypothetical protein|nr:DUF4253 domain-containing protein [Acidobacteriota bacterium]
MPPLPDFHAAGTPCAGVEIPVPFAMVPGSAALDFVFRMHRTHPDAHAVILAAPDNLVTQFEVFADMPPADLSLARAAGLTVESWLAEKAAMQARFEQAHPDLAGDVPGPERGPWPDAADPQRGFMGVRDILTGQHLPEVVVALSPAPVAQWWETSAHLRFGGWNDCPDPAVHVLLHRIWAEKYGARLVTMAFDVIELQITRPIRTREEALEVAALQYAYCSDIVDQGEGTLENLAASLIDATSWYFWWD